MGEMVLPAQKYFRLSKGATFDYPFQFLSAIKGGTTPVPLEGYTATWTLTYTSGQTIYHDIVAPFSMGGQVGLPASQLGTMQLGNSGILFEGNASLLLAGQLGLLNSQPASMQVGNSGTAGITRSGVLFGSNSGQIELIITASDTALIPWTSATYWLTITDPHGTITPLLTGAIGVV